MITVRSTVRTAMANGVAIVKHSFKEFAQSCIAQGLTVYHEWLNPTEGKVPVISFDAPDGKTGCCVVLSKAVAALRLGGKLPDAALKTLSIIDGKNAKGEQRYYLSANGATEITVEQAIAIGDAYQAQVQKLTTERIAKLLE